MISVWKYHTEVRPLDYTLVYRISNIIGKLILNRLLNDTSHGFSFRGQQISAVLFSKL